MPAPKKIFAIIGSASEESANLRLVEWIANMARPDLELNIFNRLADLPHFNPELSLNGAPQAIVDFRTSVAEADGVLICTPEYVFSIPSGLKNAIEWCVATTAFSDKPVGLITASASGIKGHEELKLVMKTIQAHFSEDTTLLIQGIKSKVDTGGNINDEQTKKQLERFIASFKVALP
jgi:NAD(P)H-dependent FMN reductase